MSANIAVPPEPGASAAESGAPAHAADPTLPGLELALGLFAEDTWGANAIRAEIAKRAK